MAETKVEPNTLEDAETFLLCCKKKIEKKGDIARLHHDTLVKRGISVDQCLSPSAEKDLKKIKYYARINKTIKRGFLAFEEYKKPGEHKKPTEQFSKQGYLGYGHQWDKLLSDYIKKLPVDPGNPPNPIAGEFINWLEYNFKITFLESKFALFGFMRERASDQEKTPKLYLWQGEADAIAFSSKRGKYIIVDFKVVDNLLNYWQTETDLCGKHLHQCLVYAKLLQLHMNLEDLPPIFIVVIDRVTGYQGFFPLFTDYPQQCKDKLDEYEWFKKQPPKLPLKMVINDKLFDRETTPDSKDVPPDTQLSNIFKETATVRDLLEALHLDYDGLKIVPHLDE